MEDEKNIMYKTDWDYKDFTDKDRIDYANKILSHKDGYIYGRIIEVSGNAYQMMPCDSRGREIELFKMPRHFKIGVSKKNKDINKNDYVRGKIIVRKNGNDEWFYFFPYVEKLSPESEFVEKVTNSIKKIWNKNEFRLEDSDFKGINGDKFFMPLAMEKLEAGFEERYKEFIKTKENELDSIKKQTQLENEVLEKISSMIKEADDKYEYYREIGIIKEQKSPDESWKDYEYDNYEELIKQVWGCLWNNKNLWYEKAVIRAFMNSLRTSQLTLLWGRPGTGKTSLPEKAAQVLGAKCIRIQVQSNWTDNQDLLGFYNIVDKRYMSTPFMDALIEAKENKNQLYFILLDEMNLSNIEYYFSEMLNVFTVENPRENPYELHLYSERIKQRTEAQLESAKAKGMDISELSMQLEDMFYYPPTFKIPSNVRFIGTLNTDATTKIISPKVIDRSCLIELQTMSVEKKKDEKKHLPKKLILTDENLHVGADIFAVHFSSNKTIDKQIEKIDNLRSLGVNISNRIELYIKQLMADEQDKSIDLDEIALTKILPAINGEYDEELIKNLKIGLQGCDRTLEKLIRMEESAKQTKRITYWED